MMLLLLIIFVSFVRLPSVFLLSALGGGGGEEDQVPGGSAGGDPNEEAGDQAEALWRAWDHYGPRERGRKSKMSVLRLNVEFTGQWEQQMH